jgi:hypothetical protein
VRRRDPRSLVQQRRRELARVKIVEMPESGHHPDGSITSKQVAVVFLPRSELERIWTPEYLERLARTYWRFLTRISLGLLRVVYGPDSREIVFLTKPFALLHFKEPEYDIDADAGTVTWRINKGLLVAPAGRGKGYLRISVRRRLEQEDHDAEEIPLRVSSEVNFHPMIAGWGWFTKIGRAIYRATQLRIHIIVTHAFLRSLARLDLAESRVGALLPEGDASPAAPPRSPAASGDRGER